tara:strand:- start:11891 stop:12880 length:990 start_codon:yes stop_codon:yes gene_type:complete
MNTKEKSINLAIEKTMRNILDQAYDEMIHNFSLNLDKIWKEPSASAIINEKRGKKNQTKKRSVVVIGRGPSIKKKNHLELLADSNYKGAIICTDGNLVNVLEHGVTPKKFPEFYVISVEPYKRIFKLYDNKIIEKYKNKIKGFFPTVSNPDVVNRARKAGILIHWFHNLYDLNHGKRSLNYIFASMVRTKNHPNGLPALQTGGNVGTSAWFLAWKILKFQNIGLIGMNQGWDITDSWETILSHNSIEHLDQAKNVNKKKYEQLIEKVYNPDLKEYCLVDPIFRFYRNSFLEFISRSPERVKTINATEGGSLFGKRIKQMPLSKFLKNYS